MNTKIKELNDEQENLLVLLTEMEVKLKKYKRIVKQHGHEVSEDENDDEPAPEPVTVSQPIVKAQEPVRLDQVNLNSQFYPQMPQLQQPLSMNEPPKPQIAHSIFSDSNPSNNINFTSTNSNNHHHHHHHHDHEDHHDHDYEDEHEPEPQVDEQKLNLADYRATTAHESNGAESAAALQNQHYDLEPTLNYPRNNIFQILESKHTSDNSSLESEHYNHMNNTSSSSSNGTSHNNGSNFSPENPILQAMHHNEMSKMHEIKFNHNDPQSSQFSQLMPNNYAENTAAHQFHGQSNSQFNFFQYFNNPSQTEQLKSQVAGGQANSNPLKNYFQ